MWRSRRDPYILIEQMLKCLNQEKLKSKIVLSFFSFWILKFVFWIIGMAFFTWILCIPSCIVGMTICTIWPFTTVIARINREYGIVLFEINRIPSQRLMAISTGIFCKNIKKNFINIKSWLKLIMIYKIYIFAKNPRIQLTPIM